MPHPKTAHCLNDEQIRRFVDQIPTSVPHLPRAEGLAIGEHLVLVSRHAGTPGKIVVEIRTDPQPGESTKGRPSLRLVCTDRPGRVRRNILLACERAYVNSLRSRLEGQSFCNQTPDPAMQPGTFVMTKLTPGEPPPPEANATLETFMEMDLEAMTLENYQVMGLGRYRMGVRRDLDRPRWFVVQLTDSHGDHVITEDRVPQPALRDSMRKAAGEAMALTLKDAAEDTAEDAA